MHAPADAVASALFVEPEITARLGLLHAAHEAGAQLELSCVATCGGARHALENADFDCLLLSTSLCCDEDERRDLATLVHAARASGVAVISVGPGDLSALGLPVHASLSYADIAADQLGKALEWACMRAKVDGALATGEDCEEFARCARVSRSLAPALAAWGRGEVAALR